MPARPILMAALTGALMATAGPARGEFVVESGYHGSIRGEGNTLWSLADSLRDREVLERVDDRTLVCKMSPYIYGQLILTPGERLVIDHPNWGRRFVFIYGETRWEDCVVEGAAWVDVGHSAQGWWRNVTVRAGETRGYPVVWFRSPALEWEGGLVDCFPARAQEEPAATCIGTRAGYIPGGFANTIRNVTFRCFERFLSDQSGIPGHDVDLTLAHCVIETTGAHTARIVSNVKATDGTRSIITLKDCIRRHDGVDAPASTMIERGELRLEGSACRVRFVEQGRRVAEARADGLTRAAAEPGNLLSRLTRELEALRPELQRRSADERLRGTLCYARARAEDLAVMRAGLHAVGWYGEADAAAVEAALAQVQDTLDKAPLTLEVGSPYRPAAVPLDPPPPGEARIEALGDGRLRVRTHASRWVYDRNAGGDRYATFLPESRVRGRPIVGGAYPGFGGPSVRYLTPSDSGTMLWEFPWTTRIARERGRVVAFETEVRTSDTYGARATWVFFHDLPEVILCNARSLQEPPAGEPYRPSMVRWQAYGRPDLGKYNGMRLWNTDPDCAIASTVRVRKTVGAADTCEPRHGFFFGESPWYISAVSKGLLLAQWNGYNHWGRNPPCGFIVRANEMMPPFTLSGEYFTLGPQAMRRDPPRDVDDLNTQVLWFEGAGLKCWENIERLEAAFSHPCRPLLDLTAEGPARLKLWEPEGLARPVEIVCLPRPYAVLESPCEWYRGDVCVTLLRDVPAGAEIDLGRLPVTWERRAGGARLHNGGGLLRDLWIRVPAPGEGGSITVNQEPAAFERQGEAAVFRCDLPAGDTVLRIP